jgi:DNA-binding CsgD family transcriptional regulator
MGGEAVHLARSHGDTLGIAMASYVVGVAHFNENQIAEARRHLHEAVDGFRALDRPGRLGWALCYLASLDSRDAVDEGGDAAALERAIGFCEEALRLFQRVGQRRGVVRATHGLAYLAYKIRDLPRALASTQEILALDWEEHRPVYHYLEDIADIAGRVGQPELAARLYGAADAQRARLGVPLEPAFGQEYERDLEISRSAVGRTTFENAWAAGRATSMDDAVQAALRLSLSPAPPAAAGQAVISGEISLTPRERELLPLLAAGMSDAEIAAALFLSVRTVESHVHRLTAKLGVHGRAAAVEAVRAAGLLSLPTEEG